MSRLDGIEGAHRFLHISPLMDFFSNCPGTAILDFLTTLYSNFSYSYLQGSTQRVILQSISLLDPIGQSATYTRTYTYDSQNRLTEATVTNNGMQVEDWKYGYDHVGNRTSYSVLSSGENVSYSYNAANELTTKVDGATTTTYTYDANGNQTGSTGGPSFTYNTKNQTTAIGSDSYTYSGPDQRDRVTVNSTSFVYSGLGLSSQSSSGGTTYYTRCSCGLLNSEQTPDGKRYYYLFDGLGSIVGLTDSTGSEVNAYDYDPYGNMLNQKEGVSNPWKYAGGYLDSSTSLYKFGVRYYDPTLGRWTQQDPVGGSLGDLNAANRYVYADDDPVNAVDPSGKFGVLPIIGGFFGLFPIPVGIIALLSQTEAQEVASGAGLAVVIAILALLPAPFEFPSVEIFVGVAEYEANCGSLGVNVYLYFSGMVDFYCGS